MLNDSLPPQILQTVSFPATSGWQDWKTFSNFAKVYMEKGDRKIRLFFRKTPFNLNWILFELYDGEILGIENKEINFNVYPNPAIKHIKIKSGYVPQKNITYKLIDINGKVLFRREKFNENQINEYIHISNINSDLIILHVYDGNELISIKKILIKE